uniref:DUF4806 domain-containing protein n=1 Tax=Anopheles culicifacies TaxID=139723 RepID=A0A182M217_9DIPT
MNEGFYRIQKTMVALMHKRTAETIAPSATGMSASSNPTFNRNESFNVKPLKTVEEMDAFEERLNDEAYRNQVYNWIDSCVSYERNPECRMMEILDLVFDRHLLPNFSWTGVSSKGGCKHAFGAYKNIILLFVYVGTTSIHRADKTYVANFFMKKLRHAGFRAATLKGLRRCVPHSPAPRNKNRKRVTKTINATDSGAKYVKISKVEYGNVESDEHSGGMHAEYKPAMPMVDHAYTEYKELEIVPVNDLHPTLFMSAEDESD